MDFEIVIRKREAVRKFKNEKISKENLKKILEAGRVAPTAKNIQPQRIFVIESEESIAKLDKLTPCRYGAPTVLLVCADKSVVFTKEGLSTDIMDASIVATHMMLEAANLDIDSIWIEYFDIKKMQKAFDLLENIVPVCLLPLGYRTEDYVGNPMHTVRKELTETVKYI